MKMPPAVSAVVSAIAFAGSPARADYPSEVLADGPVGYWRLGEAAGATSALDASGGGRHLDYSLLLDADFAQPGAIVGDPDGAVRFTPTEGPDAPLDGSPSTHPSIISTDSNDFGFAPGASFTLEYWIRADPGNTSHNGAGILTKGYSTQQATPWYLSRYNEGSVDFFLRDINNTSNSVNSISGIADGNWHQVVGVYDAEASEIRLYIDGELEATSGAIPADAYSTNSEPFTIGNHFNRRFDGWLDEVAVYDSALADQRVRAHYEAAGIVQGGGGEPALLAVDFGSSAGNGGGPGGVQSGFGEFESSEGDTLDPVTLNFASGAAATGGEVAVTVEGYTHWRDYAAVSATYGLDELLSDNVLRNADGVMTLTIDALRPGVYKMTTYHVSTQFGGGTFGMTLADALGSTEIGAEIPAAKSGELQQIELELNSDGSPIQLVMTGGSGPQHLCLNGFTISAPDGPPLAITEIQFDPSTRTAEFTWNSTAGASYKVDFSDDGEIWAEFDDSFPSAGETTSYADENIPDSVDVRLYRVSRN